MYIYYIHYVTLFVLPCHRVNRAAITKYMFTVFVGSSVHVNNCKIFLRGPFVVTVSIYGVPLSRFKITRVSGSVKRVVPDTRDKMQWYTPIGKRGRTINAKLIPCTSTNLL